MTPQVWIPLSVAGLALALSLLSIRVSRRAMRASQRLADLLREVQAENDRLRELLEDARSYITPTISTHEDISAVLGWCDCGYCSHVPSSRP